MLVFFLNSLWSTFLPSSPARGVFSRRSEFSHFLRLEGNNAWDQGPELQRSRAGSSGAEAGPTLQIPQPGAHHHQRNAVSRVDSSCVKSLGLSRAGGPCTPSFVQPGRRVAHLGTSAPLSSPHSLACKPRTQWNSEGEQGGHGVFMWRWVAAWCPAGRVVK